MIDLADQIEHGLRRAFRTLLAAAFGIRQELDRLHMVEIKSACGHVLKRTEMTEEQRRIFNSLDIKPPRAIERITAAEPTSR